MKRDNTSILLLTLGLISISIPLILVACLLAGIWIWSLGINIPLTFLVLLSYLKAARQLGL